MSYWVAGAAVVGAVGGALVSKNGAKGAANAQSAASQSAIDEQRRQFDINQANQQPYLDAGKIAIGQYQTAINTPTTAADVMSGDPGYQFRQDQGQTALDRKIAAMGGRVSGAALKESARYNQDYASGEYNSAYQRSQDRLNRLASLAGLGQTATNASAASGSNSANAISGLISSQGDATAASRLSQSNIWGNAGNQLAAIYGRYGSNSSPTNYYGNSGGGVGTGAYTSGGQTYNNPSAYVGP